MTAAMMAESTGRWRTRCPTFITDHGLCLTHMPLKPGMWDTCCICDLLSPWLISSLKGMFTVSYSTERKRGGHAWVDGCYWMDSCSNESLPLPAPHFLFPACSHGYVMRLHTSGVSATADSAAALWFIAFLVRAHRNIRACTDRHSTPRQQLLGIIEKGSDY